ncbi:hypothetical protein PAAG_11151 [Paracoccidioides lutzii Pb01]|uniref:Uncharacterized protein n=1 Tax=Paracoccidioides lutzii (strain ATCC MYA-826 / Pb01) TaxID=502779 RepID=A0A0A2V3A6_PARBA|nr:hypothetical protein PAAG_11151 [Paracoccidioides lutzii Pb01]KGQ01978.1 hypothetical protein PAAG_11151 [Paracoccidioides lutzii Pb01]
MSSICPYCHVSYVSWRLKTFRRQALEAAAGPFAPFSSRSFTTSSSFQFPKPNPNQKKRRGNPKRERIQELDMLDRLHTQISGFVEELKNKPQTVESSEATAHNEQESAPGQPTRLKDIPPLRARPSQSLPKSPIVTRLAQRGTKSKSRATKLDIDRLKYNPWAQILASPVRMCVATGARIPEKLMGDWGLVQHPETCAFWLTPVDLFRTEFKQASAKRIPAPPAERDEGAEGDSVPHHNVPSFHMTNTVELIDAVVKLKGERLPRLVPSNWKVPRGTLSRNAKYVFRKDLPVFVLDRTREVVLRWLKKTKALQLAGEISGDLTVLDVGTEAIGKDSLQESLRKLGGLEHAAWGAVFISRSTREQGKNTGTQGEEQARGGDDISPSTSLAADPRNKSTLANSSIIPESDSESASVSDSLPKYITLPSTGSMVPVFDLTMLLTEEQLDALCQHAEVFRNPAVFYRPGSRAPVSMISWLWRLKLYMLRKDKL